MDCMDRAVTDPCTYEPRGTGSFEEISDEEDPFASSGQLDPLCQGCLAPPKVASGACASEATTAGDSGGFSRRSSVSESREPPLGARSWRSESSALGSSSRLSSRRGSLPLGLEKLVLSMPKALPGFRTALADNGYSTGAIIGRSSVNRGNAVIVATKAGVSFAAKGTDEGEGTGVLAATLRHEYQTLRSLSHPGIVRAEAMIEAPCGCAMVMDLCPGVCLKQLMPQGSALCEERRHGALLQLLDILTYLHSRQVAHRDLHAQNVLVDAPPVLGSEGDFRVRIVDFGSAKHGAGGGDCTFADLEDLTPEILPPDTTGDSPLGCDVFAVALLAAGLLAGHPVFTAQVVRGQALSLPESFLALSATATDHLCSMLALRPEARPSAPLCRESLPPFSGWMA